MCKRRRVLAVASRTSNEEKLRESPERFLIYPSVDAHHVHSRSVMKHSVYPEKGGNAPFYNMKETLIAKRGGLTAPLW